ncbi:membrane protein [Polaribacter pacificus]|uniref:Membrane protein n=1 Tax=Polaribacter pacificus TaxID=1775173 RepID=A0A917HZZ1_9FLAO|nr:MFS transporter [Polaribacter pacificus]GGG98897.1 membrane protein [Polaribacter pacificus]
MQKAKLILPIIVISQFLGTSLWFAGNAVLADLVINFNLDATALQSLTSAVQFGFITGTLLFALLTIADRFSPSKVFFVCAILGATFNAGLVLEGNTLTSILGLRFLTGFFLAGIYPVGMKIATDYYQKGLGKSLGYLVGALVLGTAFPHLLKDQLQAFPWERIILFISLLASLGGLLLYLFVPNGPFRKKSTGLQLNSCIKVFKNTAFRKAAFGYFGHMWELYTFWAFVPILLKTYASLHPNTNFNIPLLSFFCIAVGSLACVLGSSIAEKFGAKKTAMSSLFLSCCCCLLSPLFFLVGSETVFVVFLLFWGMVVIADSPLFSQLVAENAPQKDKGTALTIVNCIGFSLTILSIQVISYFYETANTNLVFMLLAIGPVLGLLALRKKRNTEVFSEARE